MATIRQGSKGDEVKKLQNALIGAGYDVGSTGADGVFGSKTASAVKAYQKANGLSVDGIVGSQTWGSLNKASTNNTPSTKVDTKVADDSKKTYHIDGVDDDLLNYDLFSPSDGYKGKTDKLNNQGTNLDALVNKVNKGDVISDGTWATINSSFSPSSSYNKAMKYTNELLAKLSSGRTSYTDDVEAMMQKILNREDFSYDVDKDQLFQQALASAMNSGKSAMQDTIGQASALTGGYGSTYATSAGNQAYNAFIEDAYNNLPEYYQMALQAYQMEGEEMYNQLGMFVDADNREYQRTYDAWNANFANAESMYNKEYGAWQDGVNNAFQSANLQLNEFGTGFNANVDLYNIYKDDADTTYQREYQAWADEVAQKTNIANLQHSDYWSNKNFDEGVRQFEKEYALQRSKASSGGGGGRRSSGGGGGGTNLKSPTSTQISNGKKAWEEGGMSGYISYVDSLPDNVNIAEIDAVVGAGTNMPMYYKEYTKSKETYNGGFNWFGEWNVDNNDEVTDQHGNTYKVKDLPKDVQMTITEAPKGETYVWSPEEKKWIIKPEKN